MLPMIEVFGEEDGTASAVQRGTHESVEELDSVHSVVVHRGEKIGFGGSDDPEGFAHLLNDVSGLGVGRIFFLVVAR